MSECEQVGETAQVLAHNFYVISTLRDQTNTAIFLENLTCIMDRHKGKRTYTSGSMKRKLAKEKDENVKKELTKIQKLTDFVKVTPKPKINPAQTEQEVEVTNSEAAEIEVKGTASNETQHQETIGIIHVNDIGLWSAYVSRNEIEYWAENGSKKLHICDKSLFEDKSRIQNDGKVNRKCNIS